MKYYVTENRNLKVWTEKPDKVSYFRQSYYYRYYQALSDWQDAFDKQPEILTSPELKEQLTPGQVIDEKDFQFDFPKDEKGRIVIGNIGYDEKVKDLKVTPELIAVPLDTATEDYPDLLQQVRAHIKSHKLFNWDEALTGYEMELLEDLLLTFSPKLRQGTVGNPMPATEESNLREAEVEAVKRYPDFKYEGIMGPVSAQRAQQQIELRRKDFIAGWEAARKALAALTEKP
jgi:uncharacterized protein YfeS